MLRRCSLFLCLFLGLCVAALAQQHELVLTGVYNGKNLYVQNPLADNLKDYCTQEVLVNDKLVYQNPRSSAYTINLSHLPDKAPVVVKIRYSTGCMPKVINPQVVRQLTSFKYLAVNIDSSSVSWTTNNQQKGGKFFVEQGAGDQWQAVATVTAVPDQTRYSTPVTHTSGSNRYRIKFLQDDGEMYYSTVTTYTANVSPITFTPTRVSEKIFLSRITDYEVTDTGGKPLLKGSGNEIFVGNLTTGVYYLKIENRTERFFKK